MSLDPILDADAAIQIHVVAAVLSVLLGPFVLLRRSRDRWHKRLGYTWVIAMFVTAASSFWIMDIRVIGPFSPIHLLSALTIYGLGYGVWQAIKRQIEAHQQSMKSLYFWSMGVAGLFTFLPGRRMNMVLFGDASEVGFGVMAALIGGGLVWYAVRERRLKRQTV